MASSLPNTVKHRSATVVIITPENDIIEIKTPLAMRFSIHRGTMATANNADLTIKNLGAKVRSRIYRDKYRFDEKWGLIIRAGYDGVEKVVFAGNIRHCYSYKEKTEWITTMSGFDGLFPIQNTHLNVTIDKDTPATDILKKITGKAEGLKLGFIDGIVGKEPPKRSMVVLGRLLDVLSSYTDDNYFIDNETLHCLSKGNYLGDTVLQLTPDWLLGTPRRADQILTCKTIFYPDASVANLVNLESKFTEYNTKQGIIQSIKHDFEYSSNSAGTGVTMIGINIGARNFRKAIESGS